MTKINHDLRNSLATAMLVSDRLVHSDDPDVRRVAPRLLNAVDKAVGLCSQTLEFAREHRLVLDRELVYLGDLVAETEALLHPMVPDADGRETERGLTLELAEGSDQELEVDRDHMVRVLVNLARNSGQAGATKVTVRLERNDFQTVIDVEDDGPGLAGEVLENLFKPFIGTTRKSGTGLGLVIARDIVEAHGGSLDLFRTGESGSVFRIILPDPDAESPPATETTTQTVREEAAE